MLEGNTSGLRLAMSAGLEAVPWDIAFLYSILLSEIAMLGCTATSD